MGTNKILIVDDALESRLILRQILTSCGYHKLHEADGAAATFAFFGLDPQGEGLPSQHLDLGLILLDIVMPGLDGIEICRRLKATEYLRDIPVIMVTADRTDRNLQTAFELGAVDYIYKPPKQVELCARVKSALRLKKEMDRQLELTTALEEANRHLQRMTLVDGLTGICNRRCLDDFLDREWRRCQRDGQYIAICLFDIDYFKPFNDFYGHLRGDEVLKQVAATLQWVANRPGDLVARFGGEEFVFVLSGADAAGAQKVVQRAIDLIRELAIPHPQSPVNEYLTVSCGISAMRPVPGLCSNLLLDCADKALYEAKLTRNNHVVTLSPSPAVTPVVPPQAS